MSSPHDHETPLFVELVEERGFNPFDLATKVAEEIVLATKAAEETIRENVHYLPRYVT